MKMSSVNWKNNFSQLGDFFNSTKLIVFLNIYSKFPLLLLLIQLPEDSGELPSKKFDSRKSVSFHSRKVLIVMREGDK